MIKFISVQNREDFPYSQVPETEIEYKVKSIGLTRDELLEEFQNFMKAIGYQFQTGDYLAVVNEEEDFEIDSDDTIVLDSTETMDLFGGAGDVTFTIDDSDVDFDNYTISLETEDKTHRVLLTEVELEGYDDDSKDYSTSA